MVPPHAFTNGMMVSASNNSCVEVGSNGMTVIMRSSIEDPVQPTLLINPLAYDDWVALIKGGDDFPTVDGLSTWITDDHRVVVNNRSREVVFTVDEWGPFLEGARAGVFDRDRLEQPAATIRPPLMVERGRDLTLPL
jgi:hypothetical protein